MASSYSGYKGFRSWAGQECPTLKPGETYDSRATKFSVMGQSIMNTQPTSICVKNPAYSSVHTADFGLVTKADYAKANNLSKDSYNDVVAGKSFLGISMYQSDFVHFQNDAKNLVGIPMEKYKRAFETMAKEDDERTEDGIVCIPRDRIKELLTIVYGKIPTTRMLDIYAHMLDPIPDSKISWQLFLEATERIMIFVVNNTSKMQGKASWMEYLKSHRVLPGVMPSSSYQIDYGMNGSNPLDRPYLSRTKGMASTTSDLADGTTKNTFHIPRYAGFMPETQHNPDAVTQGDCNAPRTKGSDLRLYHLNNIPGYTGFIPEDSKNVRGEATTGTDPRTTNGFIYRPHT
ncbi:hypothetical protein THRCLA_21594 [Thraustotheca clavata]|uniref:Uncharacterized protein n=1 Tax=Thraustotheca clavata TaxID=74557 RepID=A0A1V9ZV44_9STRA|nr:hypothetical protein THRCLA_21594 [Thraustotheca clavata]